MLQHPKRDYLNVIFLTIKTIKMEITNEQLSEIVATAVAAAVAPLMEYIKPVADNAEAEKAAKKAEQEALEQDIKDWAARNKKLSN